MTHDLPERDGTVRDADDLPPAPVPGRGKRLWSEIGLRRLKASWLLRACAIAAFMGYGGLAALVLAERLPFTMALIVAGLSLSSWFFLFWWYPVQERTLERLAGDPRREVIGGTLEAFAVGCVVLVHVLMAVIVVYSARS